jgi:Transglycosylase SLT domain
VPEAVSPELALVDPDLRRSLATGDPWVAFVQSARQPEPPPAVPHRKRRRLERLGVTAIAYALLLSIVVTLGARPAASSSAEPVDAIVTPPPARALATDESSPEVLSPRNTPSHASAAPGHLTAARPARRAQTGGARTPARRETEPVSDLLGPLAGPTPARLRLSPTAARALLDVGGRYRVDWAMLLAAARLHGIRWSQARPSQLAAVARGMKRGRVEPSARAAALAAYERAVGLDALVSGLTAARSVLAARVLRDPRIQIYPAGRSDIATGRVDVRVLVLLLYLARTQGSVAVSSLVSGHAPPGDTGSPSAHLFGAAVDLRALAGVSVLGHQEPGGRIERAIRGMLLLPAEVRPRQIFSLLSLGGPTVALADHDRVIHVGFDPTVSAGGALELLWRIAGAAYDVPWTLLGAINGIETDNGRLLQVSPAGAVGWMQFMPSTWRRYGLDADGNGTADPWNPTDAVFSAARYLTAAGVQSDPSAAIWAYNHAGWYVDDVLARARRLEDTALPSR